MNRKQRSDTGQIRITERDIEAIRWLAEQYGASVDTVADLLGYLGGREEALAVPTMAALLRRWREAGWIETRKLMYKEPAWIWPTLEGLKLAGEQYNRETGEGLRTWKPEGNWTLLQHIDAVARVRLFVERNYGGTWISERRLAKGEGKIRGGQRRAHRPDAVLERDGQSIAIEVELSAKRSSRTLAIMAENVGRYNEVWYFVGAPAMAVVIDSYGKLPAEFRERVKVIEME